MGRTIRSEIAVTLPNTPEELWPFVSDTNRIDRAVGLPRVYFARGEQREGGEKSMGEYRVLGVPVARWIERPFDWERPKRYSVTREYQSGPLSRFQGGTELEPTEGGTRIRVFAEFIPRNRLFDPIVRFGIAPQSMRRATGVYRALGAYLAGQAAAPFPVLAESRSSTDVRRLDELIARLRGEGASAGVTAGLRSSLAEAPDDDVYGMRPLELAGRWGTERRETLEAFLRATVLGLLEMRWELLCPSCRGTKADAAHLQDLAAKGHCSACNVDIVANVDEAIEARFYPAPSVRTVNLGTYCVGNPGSTPHRVAQAVLEPGERREWQLTLAPGPYVIRSPQSRGNVRLRAVGGPGGRGDGETEGLRGRIGAPGEGVRGFEVQIESMYMAPEEAEVEAGSVFVRVASGTAHRATVTLDDASWLETAATPSRLMLVPSFHELFSAEALAPGVELAISRVGLLFTDLAGSTALYERVGDARAFRLVSGHFTILRRTVQEQGGALIKTIGDAVMAVFPDGRSALAAGLAIQRNIHELETGGLVDPLRLVKVGVHAGACFAVTLNEQLDYFGTAVNLAARAQHEALGGEVVATASVFDEAAELLTSAGLRGEPREVLVKGLSTPVLLYRVDCTGVTVGA